jgi:predicted site-specific integrase-resolvase
MKTLLTAAAIGPMFSVTATTVLRWMREGRIKAEVHTGNTVLFDPDEVRAALVKKSKRQAKPNRNSTLTY